MTVRIERIICVIRAATLGELRLFERLPRPDRPVAGAARLLLERVLIRRLCGRPLKLTRDLGRKSGHPTTAAQFRFPGEMRRAINREFEGFILGSIDKRISLAIDTTLRNEDQARMARPTGDSIEIRYLVLQDSNSGEIRTTLGSG